MRSRRFLGYAAALFLLAPWVVPAVNAQQQPMDSPQQPMAGEAPKTPTVTPGAAAAVANDSKEQKDAANAQVNAAKSAADAQAAAQQQASPSLQHRDPRYRVNKADVLTVNFVFTPEYDQTLQVQPDGYIVPRGVGDVRAEGLTIPEVTAELEKAYGKILHDPVITVLPTTVVPAYFIAGGEVSKPGRYSFEGDTTVTQAVQIAGGFTTSAKHSQVVLFRRINNDWVQGTKIDVKKMLKEGNLAEDLHLEPGDMLYVPKNTISKVQPWLIPFSQFVSLNLLARPISF